MKNLHFKKVYDAVKYGEPWSWIAQKTNLSYHQTLRKIKQIREEEYSLDHKLKACKSNHKSFKQRKEM